MKTVLFAFALMISMAATASATDVPVYRASFTGTGVNPTVTVTPQIGDALFVFVASAPHIITDLHAHTATDDVGGSYWDQYCGAAWNTSVKKDVYVKTDMLVRGQIVTSTTPIHISVGSSGKSAAVVVIAVSGLTDVNNYPAVDGCGTLNTGGPGQPHRDGSIRQVKHGSFAANATPATSGGPNAFLATSLVFAVVVNGQSTPTVTPPTGFAQRATAGISTGTPFGIAVSTIDAGFSGTQVTWGSTSTLQGVTLAAELQAIQ